MRDPLESPLLLSGQYGDIGEKGRISNPLDGKARLIDSS
jgi:hypothetical protein